MINFYVKHSDFAKSFSTTTKVSPDAWGARARVTTEEGSEHNVNLFLIHLYNTKSSFEHNPYGKAIYRNVSDIYRTISDWIVRYKTYL